MLKPLKRFVDRFDSPFLTLLVSDARFTIAILSFALIFIFAFAGTLKIWKRSLPGFQTDIRVSALDLLQGRALSRFARKAEERGDLDVAISSWSAALANDPFNEEIGLPFLKALLLSSRGEHTVKAMQVALWLREFSTNTEVDALCVMAAERNKDWGCILQLTERPRAVVPSVRLARLKALFWTGKYRHARDYCSEMDQEQSRPGRELYYVALDCLVGAEADREAAYSKLVANAGSVPLSIEKLEVFLAVCFQRRDLSAFEEGHQQLKRITNQTLLFDLLHAQLLSNLGFRQAAREAAARLPPPASARETFQTASSLLKLGLREDAILILRSHLDDFFDSIAPWILYAQLLVESQDKDGLREIANRLQRVTPLDAFAAAIDVYLDPGRGTLGHLSNILSDLPRDRHALVWYFVSQALVASGHPSTAVETLLRVEPFHLADLDFYDRLFAVAEAARNAVLMRRAAERRYQLAPTDIFSIGNHAAMLTMFDEQPETAAELTALCAQAQPASFSAQINHAAALINSERFGSADLILRKIDEDSIPSGARNQLRFIKIKRAVKLGLSVEARSLAAKLDKSALYSRQIQWLSEKNL